MRKQFTGRLKMGILAACLVAAICGGQIAISAQFLQTSTEADQKDLSITVYRSGSAMIRDTRRLEIPPGAVQVKFSDVARNLVPDSVQVISTTAPSQLRVLQQTYAYGLLSPLQLLQAYVGKTLTIVLARRENGSDVEEAVQATLLAANPGPVWRINGKIEMFLRVDHYVFPDIPANLSAKPSLILLLKNEHSGEQELRVSYFTNGLTWAANYVLNVAPDWESADLSARATINNQSGTDYSQAKLQLVAGQVKRVYETVNYGGSGQGVGGGIGGGMMGQRVLMSAPAPPPAQPFAGYHLYTVRQPVDLPNDNLKQVSLIEPAHIQITRSYQVYGEVYYNQGAEPGSMLSEPVQLHLKLVNSRANSLGMPLPAGIVRVYKKDASGRQQLVGEDQIPDTASGETVTLNLGNAFDVTEHGKQANFQRQGPRESEASYEITLRNHQSQAIAVSVNEPFSGDWQILSSSFPYKKTSATSARFHVPVPAHGKAVLTYRVHVQWGAMPGR